MTRIFLAAMLIVISQPAWAHVAERALVLLLPTEVYTRFGVAAVVLTVLWTFLVPTAFIRKLYPANIAAAAPPLTPPLWVSLLASLLFAALLLLGWFGPRNPLANLLPLTVFTLWWVCLLLLQAVVGDLWRWLNPWTGPLCLLAPNTKRSVPEWLAHWPALAGLLAFSGYYLADIAPDDPSRLAGFVALYWLFNFAMGVVFGRQWLDRCECFTVLFTLVARLSPINISQRRLCMPGHALVTAPAPSVALACLSVSFLAVGSFDGLNETFWWMAQLGINPLEFPGRSAVIGQNLAGLGAAVIALNAIFAGTVWLGLWFCGETGQFRTAFCRLALTLLPIAIAYHLAHYLTSILVNLQYCALALNDPLGKGADLLGLADRHVTTSFFNQYHTVLRIWLTQAGAIVTGHMLALLMAHAVALDLFNSHSKAIISQSLVIVFMISYTIFGLWLLASPTAL